LVDVDVFGERVEHVFEPTIRLACLGHTEGRAGFAVAGVLLEADILATAGRGPDLGLGLVHLLCGSVQRMADEGFAPATAAAACAITRRSLGDHSAITRRSLGELGSSELEARRRGREAVAAKPPNRR